MHPFVKRISELTNGQLPKSPPTHQPLFDDCPVCRALDVGELRTHEDGEIPDWLLDSEARREYEKEYWRHPRVRRCPECETAAWDDNNESARCPAHGDPYEHPFEPELRFHELFGHFPWEKPKKK